jgi:hypothetical protein
MAGASADSGPDNSDKHGDVPGPGASGGSALTAAAESAAGATGLPTWGKVLGWCGVVGLIYLLICAVSIISSGFAGLGSDAAHTMFAFAANPWVGLSVGVLGTVLIQSSTTTTAIAVTAVGSGALPIQGAIPIILGANVGTTVTTSLVALTFIGNRTEFRRALGASTVHDLIFAGNPGLRAGRECDPWPGAANRRGSLRLRGDGQAGRFWFSMYSLTMLSGAPPQEPAKYEGAQNTEPIPVRLIRPVYSARRYRELTPLRLLTSLEMDTFGG